MYRLVPAWNMNENFSKVNLLLIMRWRCYCMPTLILLGKPDTMVCSFHLILLDYSIQRKLVLRLNEHSKCADMIFPSRYSGGTKSLHLGYPGLTLDLARSKYCQTNDRNFCTLLPPLLHFPLKKMRGFTVSNKIDHRTNNLAQKLL